MANNLDMKGTVDISVDRAVRNLRELQNQVTTAWNAMSDTKGAEDIAQALDVAARSAARFKQQLSELQRMDTKHLSSLIDANKAGFIVDPDMSKSLGFIERQMSAQAEAQRKGLAEQAKLQQEAAKERARIDEEDLQAGLKRAQNVEKARKFESEAQRKGLAEQAKLQQEAAKEQARIDEESLERAFRHAAAREKAAQIEAEAQRKGLAEQAKLQQEAAKKLEQQDQEELDRAFRHAEVRKKAAQQEAQKIEDQYNKLANTRYALYDVANTFTVISAATLGAAGAAVKFGADYDQAFRSVQRTSLTTGQAAQDLKQDLIALTTEIPRSFDEITDIATLGAQMDIPTEHLTKFTETVAMFASTTDASVDKAAMSLGRLAQLTKTSVGDIDRLASSIYHVGINSVATEEQILTISEQIAASGNLAGFAADEIIGLSAAMASLGVQPEAARGAIMRIFNNIRMAVDEGGESLQKFADVAGTTAGNFANTWLKEPERAFSQFVEGLSRLSDEGRAVSMVLKDLGMSNVRDLRVMELLADNTDVYAAAMANAASAYEENSALADGYAIQVDNLNDALTVLWNNLKAIGAEVGDIPLLKDMVVWATQAVKWFSNLLKMPVVGWVAKVSLGVVAAVGAFAAWQAMSARLTASAYGLITATRGIQKSSGVAATGIKGLWKAMFSLINMNRTMRGEIALTDTQLERLHISALRAQGSISGFGAVMGKAGTYLRGGLAAATSFMSSMVVPAAVIGGIAALTAGIKAVSDSLKDAEARSRDFLGSSSGLHEALVEDGRIYEESGGKIGVYVGKVTESKSASEGAAEAYLRVQDGQLKMQKSYEDTTKAIEGQTLALGENVRQIIGQKIVDEFDNLDSAGKAILETFDWENVMDKLAYDVENGTSTATDAFNEFKDSIKGGEENIDLLMARISNLDPQGYRDRADELRAYLLEPWDAIPENLKNEVEPEVAESFERIRTMAEEDLLAFNFNQLYSDLLELEIIGGSVSSVMETLGNSLEGEGLTGVFRGLISEGGILKAIIGDVGAAADDTGDDMDDLAGKTENVLDAFERLHIPAMAAEEAVENLGAALYNNGINFDIYSEGGRANFQALDKAIETFVNNADGDLAQMDASFLAMVIGLQEKGIVFEGELAYVADILHEVFAKKYNMDISTAAARGNLAAFIDAAIEALQVQARLAGENLQAATSWGAAQHYHDELVTAERALADFRAARDSALSASDERGGIDQVNALERGWNRARDAARGAGGAGKKAGRDTAKSAKEAQKEIRTLADYVSDLSSVMSRAIEFRFGVTQSKDATTDIWAGIKKRAEEAREAVNKALQDIMDANAKLKGLKSDVQILEYQLRVAEEYNDTLRATQIRAELAEKNAEITKTEKDKADAQKAAKKAQEDSSKTLKGNSDAARKNRDDIISLVQSYQKQIEALADSGLSTKDLQRETDKLRQDFIKQATQLGFNRTEVESYAKAFDDLSTIIRNVPRNITVNANVSPARKAIDEFIAKKEKSKSLPTKASKPSKSSVNAARKAAAGKGAVNIPTRVSAPTNTASVAKSFISAFRVALKAANFAASIFGKKVGVLRFYREGGYTGRGPANQVAGITHSGEYVVRREFVNQSTGLPDMNALGQHLGMNTYAGSVSSAPTTPSVAVVELSARDRQLLAAAGDVTLTLDGRVVAENTNRHNTVTSRRGVG